VPAGEATRRPWGLRELSEDTRQGKSAPAQSELKSPSRGMAVPPNLEPFPNLGGFFFGKQTCKLRLDIEHRFANRAFPKVSEQGGT